MKSFFFIFAFTKILLASNIPILTLSDSINPGSADYLIQGIDSAIEKKSPCIVIELDTPGGLLTSTRKIVQKMLASSIPVVVFISPKGAQAGSAGALITFASDIAAMAPGTNIGAAHPVSAGGEKIDKTMNEKIENDTAAFAESLAKAKNRNTDWARKSVTKSASVTAEEALKLGVIDLIADTRSQLLEKLKGFTLRTPKGQIQRLPQTDFSATEIQMTIRHRVVSFFADPNIAYLIMSLGGLCIWVEVTHPGLIFPGVLGALCVLLSLVSFQMLPIHYGALFMILLGFIFLIAELFVPSYGALGIGGILAFVFGSLYLMDTSLTEHTLSLGLILPTVGTMIGALLVLSAVLFKARHSKVQSGIESLIGAFGQVHDEVSNQPGKVFVQGELWNAVSSDGKTIEKGAAVVVRSFDKMLLTVEHVSKGSIS